MLLHIAVMMAILEITLLKLIIISYHSGITDKPDHLDLVLI
jgi:hypothetical protein